MSARPDTLRAELCEAHGVSVIHLAMTGAWLAYQWMTIGPQALQARARAKGQDDRCILVSKMWPRAAEAVA